MLATMKPMPAPQAAPAYDHHGTTRWTSGRKSWGGHYLARYILLGPEVSGAPLQRRSRTHAPRLAGGEPLFQHRHLRLRRRRTCPQISQRSSWRQWGRLSFRDICVTSIGCHILCVVSCRRECSMRLQRPIARNEYHTSDNARRIVHTWNFSVAVLLSSGVAFVSLSGCVL